MGDESWSHESGAEWSNFSEDGESWRLIRDVHEWSRVNDLVEVREVIAAINCSFLVWTRSIGSESFSTAWVFTSGQCQHENALNSAFGEGQLGNREQCIPRGYTTSKSGTASPIP